jgi:hypothetical protein
VGYTGAAPHAQLTNCSLGCAKPAPKGVCLKTVATASQPGLVHFGHPTPHLHAAGLIGGKSSAGEIGTLTARDPLPIFELSAAAWPTCKPITLSHESTNQSA